MKFNSRRAISPIIATLLLIAITVAAGIIVYVFVNGLAGNLTQGGGQQTSERLQMQSYNFVEAAGTCLCSQQILQIFLLNSGPSSSTISAVYYDGAQQALTATPASPTAIANAAYTDTSAALINDYSTASCTATAGASQNLCFTVAGPNLTYTTGATGQVVITFTAAQTAGASHTVKVVSTTGATFVFTVIAGRTG